MNAADAIPGSAISLCGLFLSCCVNVLVLARSRKSNSASSSETRNLLGVWDVRFTKRI